MAKKLLLDMIKLRSLLSENPGMAVPEGFFRNTGARIGLKPVRELAVFSFTCRRCEDAPCVAVCPAEALEKDREGLIDRHLNLCISCKSCVTVCPFGTMMTDFFKYHRNKDLFYDLDDDEELDLFVRTCPSGIATFTDLDESPEMNIYRLNDRVLVRDFMYVADQKKQN